MSAGAFLVACVGVAGAFYLLGRVDGRHRAERRRRQLEAEAVERERVAAEQRHAFEAQRTEIERAARRK